MTSVFIAGSISISNLHQSVQERIRRIVSSDFNVVVGDADGADTAIQECLLASNARKVTIYCTGNSPRNNVANWPVHQVQSKARAGSRAFFTAKDLKMAKDSDFGLMIWDCKSTGTLSNVIELLGARKKSVVFVNKCKSFVNVGDKSGLDHLLSFMSQSARAKAEEKISLSAKIAALSQESLSFEVQPQDYVSKVAAASIESASDQQSPEMPSNIVESESVKLRTALMSALTAYIAKSHLSQSQAAKMWGVTQPRISDLTRGKVDVFGLDTLVNMASTAGLHIEMRVSERV